MSMYSSRPVMRQQGFTLLEVLAAFVIFALSVAVIFEIIGFFEVSLRLLRLKKERPFRLFMPSDFPMTRPVEIHFVFVACAFWMTYFYIIKLFCYHT